MCTLYSNSMIDSINKRETFYKVCISLFFLGGGGGGGGGISLKDEGFLCPGSAKMHIWVLSACTETI